MAQTICGIDIGGANLKFADHQGHALQVNFPLWKSLDQLPVALAQSLAKFDHPEKLAITMTGELADCFFTKQEGVEKIIAAVEKAMPADAELFVWQTAGEFVDANVARENWELTAAANWHALATWTARTVPQGRGLLIDIGSTTTDIIPLENGLPCPLGLTDKERLISGELLYLGVSRTPVLAVAPLVHSKFLSTEIQLEQGSKPEIRVAAEFFATMADVYLLTEDLTEQPENVNTADGRPLIIPYSLNRLSHQFCCDLNEITENQLRSYASFLKLRQIRETVENIEKVLINNPLLNPGGESSMPTLQQLIISGEGEFLIPQILRYLPKLYLIPKISLNELIGSEVSSSACAYALAKLAEELL